MDIESFRSLLPDAQWKHKHSTLVDYYISDVSDKIAGCVRAFFIKLPPGGRIQPHVDPQPTVTTIYCLSSNDRCVMVFGDEEIRLKPGQSVIVDRKLEHWSKNDGDTDRIHLIVERLHANNR